VRAVLLAGRPKALLEVGGATLLERHLRILGHCGVDEAVVVTGYRAADIAGEVARLGAGPRVALVHNPDFAAGSVVSLWAARAALEGVGTVLLMDADVLYDQRLLARLIGSGHDDCFLLDRDIEPGEEPVKLCVRDGTLVDFRKQPTEAHDWHGESVGFFKLAAATARALVEAAGRYVAAGDTEECYEEAMRDVLRAGPPERFGFEDVTGLPWVEIDFAEDLARARAEVAPRLAPLPPARRREAIR
jgi:choline kinase